MSSSLDPALARAPFLHFHDHALVRIFRREREGFAEPHRAVVALILPTVAFCLACGSSGKPLIHEPEATVPAPKHAESVSASELGSEAANSSIRELKPASLVLPARARMPWGEVSDTEMFRETMEVRLRGQLPVGSDQLLARAQMGGVDVWNEAHVALRNAPDANAARDALLAIAWMDEPSLLEHQVANPWMDLIWSHYEHATERSMQQAALFVLARHGDESAATRLGTIAHQSQDALAWVALGIVCSRGHAAAPSLFSQLGNDVKLEVIEGANRLSDELYAMSRCAKRWDDETRKQVLAQHEDALATATYHPARAVRYFAWSTFSVMNHLPKTVPNPPLAESEWSEQSDDAWPSWAVAQSASQLLFRTPKTQIESLAWLERGLLESNALWNQVYRQALFSLYDAKDWAPGVKDRLSRMRDQLAQKLSDVSDSARFALRHRLAALEYALLIDTPFDNWLSPLSELAGDGFEAKLAGEYLLAALASPRSAVDSTQLLRWILTVKDPRVDDMLRMNMLHALDLKTLVDPELERWLSRQLDGSETQRAHALMLLPILSLPPSPLLEESQRRLYRIGQKLQKIHNVESLQMWIDAAVARAPRSTKGSAVTWDPKWETLFVRLAKLQHPSVSQQLIRALPSSDLRERVRTIANSNAKSILTPPLPKQRREQILQMSAPQGLRLHLRTGVVDIAFNAVHTAPMMQRNLAALAKEGYFDGIHFHRVVAGFVAQGGDPLGFGYGGPGYWMPCERNLQGYRRGTVGMALSGLHTGGSQFFVSFVPVPRLDARYTVLGEVQGSMDAIDQLLPGDRMIKVEVLNADTGPL